MKNLPDGNRNFHREEDREQYGQDAGSWRAERKRTQAIPQPNDRKYRQWCHLLRAQDDEIKRQGYPDHEVERKRHGNDLRGNLTR